ncbi:MAG: acyl-CoA dehydrogenase family protein [Alphaproteobacteria bacterium]|nr:acyl-CoA dehydrogenase [Rhodospirillaceae bacterium]MDP6023331.1 acyl-CoA dehydrogenase family protein [Alphaproteobacteria bacterium]MDP7053900.1 acyl-CoA dehydrogenase family protein [Alphaproteobacteria bacterium]MDP7227129.1 acyl-CoA dehydrogenase family protein [Alphaproteobacteria bacterium]MDP7461093.1 acyl-CoA dehydrogenase family protein [Alphaproteobacteria bacterium]|tara:strand:- start:130 stop:1815 length:1686 start_codon:yes stop_codon:yes gene_type:complete
MQAAYARDQVIAVEELLPLCGAALGAADDLLARARQGVRAMVSKDGAIDAGLIEQQQFAVHGLAWLATYNEALRQSLAWAKQLAGDGKFGGLERLLLQLGFGGYLTEMANGIAMSQIEVVRPLDLGLDDEDMAAFRTDAVERLIAQGNTQAGRDQLALLLVEAAGGAEFGELGLDETLSMVRQQFRRFTEANVTPDAHGWHMRDELIPMDVVDGMSEMGVFGLTIPEQYGGHGMGKTAMCVVSEELSRGYIGVGSLGTRSEIAAELILHGGTEDQRQHWLPKIASGEILPTAVFTEPNVGSDLGSVGTRAILCGDVYKIQGNKTWITHAARADMMTLLARSNPEQRGYRGLSMFLAEKPRGTVEEPFPAQGMSGGEIEVLGYRGMKEYEIAFDGFEVGADNLLGGEEGNGFKQLMATFESARIQTAARAVGVAQNAFELGLNYGIERQQFGGAIVRFPRVAGKLAWMAVEIMLSRQLTYYAARQKDRGRRCDLEAGMAKLLAARVAWSSADNAVQIHGGNGFSLEFPISRVLCDARILNIFEGAGEIQAQVIARRLLESHN